MMWSVRMACYVLRTPASPLFSSIISRLFRSLSFASLIFSSLSLQFRRVIKHGTRKPHGRLDLHGGNGLLLSTSDGAHDSQTKTRGLSQEEGSRREVRYETKMSDGFDLHRFTCIADFVPSSFRLLRSTCSTFALYLLRGSEK